VTSAGTPGRLGRSLRRPSGAAGSGRDAFEDDCELEVAERHVVPDPRYVAPGPPRVTRGELGPGQEAGLAVASVDTPAASGRLRSSAPGEPALFARIGPVDQGQPQVSQRIAESGHLPVDDGGDPRLRDTVTSTLSSRKSPCTSVVSPSAEAGSSAGYQLGVAGTSLVMDSSHCRCQRSSCRLSTRCAAQVRQATASTSTAVDRGQHVGQAF